MAAAKEFNIGKDTLVDFLVSKGFSKDDLKPTSKLTEDMYRSLQQEFNSDKVAKIKSDAIDLPKGSLEAKKKKEEEAQQPPVTPLVLFKKEAPPVTKKPAKEEAPPPVVQETPAPPPPPPPVVEPVVRSRRLSRSRPPNWKDPRS
jgi:translation initiation factor IF-2